jgi:hypothetical protein
VTDVQAVATLGLAIAVAVGVVRYWRQLVALAVGVVVTLSVIGLVTVLSWFGAGPLHR